MTYFAIEVAGTNVTEHVDHALARPLSRILSSSWQSHCINFHAGQVACFSTLV